MRTKSMLMALALGMLVGVGSAAGAADAQQGEPPPAGTQGMQGMHGDGMQGLRGDSMQGMQGGGSMPDMQDPRGMQDGGMGGGMMGGGAMPGGMMRGGMMGMMRGGGQIRSGAMMPQLPPGNEKLQLQMQAEMMQKMGEILGKYADRIKD